MGYNEIEQFNTIQILLGENKNLERGRREAEWKKYKICDGLCATAPLVRIGFATAITF